jgi:hypothetical protein
MILTTKDLRALLKHFDLPDEGSQEDLLKRLKYFLIRTDHLAEFESVKQPLTPSPRPAEIYIYQSPPRDGFIIKDWKFADHLARVKAAKQVTSPSPYLEYNETDTSKTLPPRIRRIMDWKLPLAPKNVGSIYKRQQQQEAFENEVARDDILIREELAAKAKAKRASEASESP